MALQNAEKFVQKEDTVLNNGQVVKTTIVRQDKLGGLDVLVYPVVKNGVDRGVFKLAWGGA